jgi:hypothetical protein
MTLPPVAAIAPPTTAAVPAELASNPQGANPFGQALVGQTFGQAPVGQTRAADAPPTGAGTIEPPSAHFQADLLGAPPALGDRILDGLRGFGDRARKMGGAAAAIRDTGGSTGGHLPGPAATMPQAAGATGGTEGQPMRLVGDMFDFAIETQLVSKGANQISSSANTLIRGQ